jgi:hypothetical protein
MGWITSYLAVGGTIAYLCSVHDRHIRYITRGPDLTKREMIHHGAIVMLGWGPLLVHTLFQDIIEHI